MKEKERRNYKMKTIEQMQEKLIKKAGMEHPLVVWFCSLCEQYEHSEGNRASLYDVMLSLDDAIDYEMELA